MEAEISKEYEITIAPRMGPGPGDAKEGRALNRAIKLHADKLTYEADPRQAERLIHECGMEGANPVGTAGTKVNFNDYENDTELPAKLHTAFRAAAARSNYLSADRIDMNFAGQEICRYMSKPGGVSWRALKRLARYLHGKPRLVYNYPL